MHSQCRLHAGYASAGGVNSSATCGTRVQHPAEVLVRVAGTTTVNLQVHTASATAKQGQAWWMQIHLPLLSTSVCFCGQALLHAASAAAAAADAAVD
jgi:hypothetical protein